MKRLQFLKFLVRSGLISLVPISFLTGKKTTKLMSCPVAGFQYYAGPELLHSFQPQQPVDLRREADNPFDKYAIAVYFKNQKIGFVPRDMNHLLARIIDNNLLDVEAEIKQVKPPHVFSGVTIEIFTCQHRIVSA